jgi:hypothetical protein
VILPSPSLARLEDSEWPRQDSSGSVFAIGMDKSRNYVPGVVATLSDMTIRGITGIPTIVYPGEPDWNSGGGVWNAGELTLQGCIISDNHLDWEPSPNTLGSYGGGLYNDHLGTTTINDCTISGNEAYWGAGIQNLGVLTVNRCKISGNYCGGGGGIYSLEYTEPGAKVDMSDCTITGNTAYFWGGAIENWAPMTLTNCLISGIVASPGGVGWPTGLGPVGCYAGWDDVLGQKGSTQIIDNTPINIFYVPP